MKIYLDKKELNLIFATLSFGLSTMTDKRQREPVEKIMTKIHNVLLGQDDVNNERKNRLQTKQQNRT